MRKTILLLLWVPALTVMAAPPAGLLLKAAVKGDAVEVKALLEQGADVDEKNGRTGWTPLTAAAYYAHAEVVNVLIGAGADANAHDANGGTPLMKAVTLGPAEDREATIARKVDIVKALLKAGADPLARDHFGAVVWEMPIVDGIDQIAQVFEDAGVKGVREQRTMNAIDEGRTEEAIGLIKKGVDINAKNDDGVSIWNESMLSGNPDLIDLAVESGADINADLGKGLTPLMVAAARGDGQHVRLFIRKGANLNALNKDGQTALDIARISNHPEIVEMLQTAAGQQ